MHWGLQAIWEGGASHWFKIYSKNNYALIQHRWEQGLRKYSSLTWEKESVLSMAYYLMPQVFQDYTALIHKALFSIIFGDWLKPIIIFLWDIYGTGLIFHFHTKQ